MNKIIYREDKPQFDMNKNVIISDDVLLEIFNFLTRKQLAKLDECCWYFHNLISNEDGGHCPPVLHVVCGKLLISLWPPSSLTTSNANGVVGGLFMLTDFISDEIHPDPEKILIRSTHMNELPPKFVRCRMVSIMNLVHPEIVLFLQRAQHIFLTGVSSVRIKTPIETPLHHWAQLFDCIHPVRTLSISFENKYAKLMVKRDEALDAMQICLRRGYISMDNYLEICHHTLKENMEALHAMQICLRRGYISMDNYLEICHHTLKENMDLIWEMNISDSQSEEQIDHSEHFLKIGKALSKWIHCRCGQDGNGKNIFVFDYTHLIAPMVRKTLTEMHNAILTDTVPLEREISMQFYSPFFNDLIMGIFEQFEENQQKQCHTKNRIIGEILEAYVHEIYYDLSGQLFVHRSKIQK